MKLTDTDAIKLPKGFFEKVDNVPKFYDWLNSLPTIDAVPVVRCKECKWRHDDRYTQYMPCTEWYPPDDFFCAYGERRTDG